MADAKGQVGHVNLNRQKLVAKTLLAGTDYNQKVWHLACEVCGLDYGANGSDFHIRKCPACQNGCPGLAFE